MRSARHAMAKRYNHCILASWLFIISIIIRQTCSLVSPSFSRVPLVDLHRTSMVLLGVGSCARSTRPCADLLSSCCLTRCAGSGSTTFSSSIHSHAILKSSISSTAKTAKWRQVLSSICSTRTTAEYDSSIEESNTEISSSSSSLQQLSVLSREEKTCIREKLNKSFFAIAAPAFIQLTAEPLASLVDTAYLGRLGPEVLGGAGVAISAQYAISKLYNDPLLRTSISLVASQDGRASSTLLEEDNHHQQQQQQRNKAHQLSVAVSSAILLAFVIGFVQLVIYSVLAESIIQWMGVTSTSPMWPHAVSYLKIRALGTPAATLWLVTNGIFRGLGDTETPLIWSLVFTGLNAILDPLFIFTLKFGASGAAAGTALAQYMALIPLLYALNKRSKIDILGQVSELKKTLKEYVEAGSFVLLRTVGKVLAYSVCAREAALLGAIAAAAYNLTFQLGFATTQICESIAVAVQTLLAREISILDTTATTTENNHSQLSSAYSVKHLIRSSIAIGGAVAFALSLVTYLQQDRVLLGLTSSSSVLACAKGIFPAVLLTQVLKGLAYPVNGIVMGGLDWQFSMLAMWAANFVCVGMIRFGGLMTLNKVWYALAAFMGTQVVTGLLRVQSRTGIWKLLKNDGSTKEIKMTQEL